MEHLNSASFHMQGMAPPPLLNQPPQIFGGYGHESMPMLPPDIAAQLGFDPSLFDDVNDPKRRRIARACDMCRKKKIKCDGKMPSCTHCINYKTECVFTQVEKKRTPPKGAKYIEGIENRLQRMENILRLSGLLEDEDGEIDLATLEKRLEEKHGHTRQESHLTTDSHTPSRTPSLHDSNAITPQSTLASPEHTAEHEQSRRNSVQPIKKESAESVEALSEMMCSLVTNNAGETRYIGSSSGFSIFSPKGIQWVNERTGDCSFQEMISEVSIDDHKWTHWKPDVFADLFRRPVYRPLPPKAEAVSLLTDFFENFNCIFPLFHQPTFMHLVERQYSSDPYQGSGWWASLNCALAIAHRLRVMSNLVPKEDDDKAWAYLKNAMGVFAELTMRNGDLLSVQALLGMALFMQGTPNPQPSFVLIAAAIRLSHSIGLHKKGSGFNLNPIETEQRKRVYWIAYLLDKDLCLRSGRPPAQDDDDTNVDLPDADPADNIGNIPLADGKGKMNIFRTMCEMTVIESKVYRRLYSAKATKLSEGEILQTISELDKELEDWKDSIPIDFRPEHEIKASHTPLMLHVVMLHLSYYNALTTIHRMTVHRGYFTSRLSEYALKGMNSRPLSPRIFASAALCASAARASISLLKYIPQADCQVVWLVLYFPVTALVTLFGNVLQNPLDPRARSDTKLMNVVVTFLATLGQEAETGGVHRMLAVCSEFERIAKVVIDKAEKEQAAKKKRKNHSQLDPPPGTTTTTQSPAAKVTTPKPSTEYNSDSGREFRSSLSPRFNGKANAELNRGSPAASVGTAVSHDPSHQESPGQWIEPFNESDMPDFANFSDLTGFGQPMPTIPPFSNPMMGNPQQPILPQDIWQVPSMALDWDWAEKFGGAYPGFENGSTMR